MDGEKLYGATDYFRPFPAPEDVFAADVAEHCRYLLPVASVNLAHLRSDWQGWAHLVAPIEPFDGLVGEGTEAFHNYLCRENWVGYKILDGKYQLACDFRYFLKAHSEASENAILPDRRSELESHYREVMECFSVRKRQFHENQCLRLPGARKDKQGKFREPPLELVELGGVPGGCNWAGLGGMRLAFSPYTDKSGYEDRVAVPKTEDGRDFCFIVEFDLLNYLQASTDTLIDGCHVLLFLDPVDQVALTTFDWS